MKTKEYIATQGTVCMLVMYVLCSNVGNIFHLLLLDIHTYPRVC